MYTYCCFLWCKMDPVWLTLNSFWYIPMSWCNCLHYQKLTCWHRGSTGILAVCSFSVNVLNHNYFKMTNWKAYFFHPILIIPQVCFRRRNVTNFLNPCLCGRQRRQDRLCRFQLLLSPSWYYFCQWSLFPSGSFFHYVRLWTPEFWLAWEQWLILRRLGCFGDFSCWHTQ